MCARLLTADPNYKVDAQEIWREAFRSLEMTFLGRTWSVHLYPSQYHNVALTAHFRLTYNCTIAKDAILINFIDER